MAVREGTAEDRDLCLDVLARSYGEDRFTSDWFEWKHRDGPWGPSRALIAADESGVHGLAFALPWQLEDAAGPVDGVRTVDGATLPSARRLGVLRTALAHEIARWDPTARPGVLMATATTAARGSHLKNGATALDPIRYRYGLPRSLRRAELDHGESVLDTYQAGDAGALRTTWSPRALRWRSDPRSGHAYDAASLRRADEANGVLYRVAGTSIGRVLLPIVMWGDTPTQQLLLGAVARAERAPVVLAPHGAGSVAAPYRPTLARGEALVCVWDRTEATRSRPASPLDLDGWALGYGDLEGVI